MPMHNATDLAHRLARNAEAVCRHYLPNGRRQGGYWLVGDSRNTPGHSMYVRLNGAESGKGAAGKWTDAATGEYGDLLDIIRTSCGLVEFYDIAEEARRFLGLCRSRTQSDSEQRSSQDAAQRLFNMSQPIAGTIADSYLRHRGIARLPAAGPLRFHPRCFYRPDRSSPTETWPAMIAAVTDLDHRITGAHRTWLDPSGQGKAPIDTPRRAMGNLLGNAVRFGMAHATLAAGEGIETMLSLHQVLPTLPMAAALSAAHLAALVFPPTLRRLYIARDADAAGDHAVTRLIDRTRQTGIEAIVLSPSREDLNEDLRTLGIDALRARIRVQLAPDDVSRFMDGKT